MADNKVKFGLAEVVYAKYTITDGNYTYETPKPIPGAVNLNLEPSGGETVFYADDIKYYINNNNQGYTGSLEMAIIPDSFKVDILGDEVDETSEVIYENADAKSSGFALGFRVKG